MDRFLLALVLGLVAVAVAAVLQRRRRPPARPGAAPDPEPPDHLVRGDFDRPDAPWLVVVFTSATCGTCASVWDRARLLGSDDVAVQEVEFSAERDLHERYAIDAVPITCVADRDGRVVTSFVGPVSSTHLWGAVAEARAPGSLPPGCGGDGHGGPSAPDPR